MQPESDPIQPSYAVQFSKVPKSSWMLFSKPPRESHTEIEFSSTRLNGCRGKDHLRVKVGTDTQ